MSINKSIELLAKKKGFSSLTALAKAMGKKPETFFNNLKYFSDHPNVNSKFGIGLQESLGISQEELRSVFSATDTIPANTATAKLLDEMFTMSSARSKEGYFLLLKILDSLQAGDEVIRCCATRPLEFDDIFFQKKISETIARGARFAYLIPTTNTSVAFDDVADRYVLMKDFKIFKESLVKILISEKGPLSLRVISNFKDRCLCSKSNDPVFLNYLHSYWSVYTISDDKMYALEETIIGSPNVPRHSISILWNLMPFLQARVIGQHLQTLAGVKSQKKTTLEKGVIRVISKSGEVIYIKTADIGPVTMVENTGFSGNKRLSTDIAACVDSKKDIR